MSTSIGNNDAHLSPTGARHRTFTYEDATPEISHLSTPKMSQQNARSVILETPPLILNTFPSPKSRLPSAPSFHSDHTPTSLDDQYFFDPLEPPAWKPPEQDEIEYVDSWNNKHNNPHHYLSGYNHSNMKNDDSSTICSSQTGNNSMSKSYGSRERPLHMQTLRPRGFSITSYGSHPAHSRHPSFGSCPQQPLPRAPPQHHRHDSLPVSLFASSSLAQSSQSFLQSQQQQQNQQNHPLLANAQQQQQNQKKMNQRTYQMIQPKKNGPYEVHSHQHVSQVRADATMAGLRGALIDMYQVDRCVDEATARMLAISDGGKRVEEGARMTSVGTLKDVQTILELHRVDKMVDRFKQGLQMPVFFEKEAMDIAILKELRGVDLEIEECRKKSKGASNAKDRGEQNKRAVHKQKQYQFELSEDEDDEEYWDQMGGGSDGIYLSTNSFAAEEPDHDPYRFYDPHETAAVASNAYQQTYAPATQDDLQDIMDLLRSDVEIDGASRRNKELEMVRPLLEVDRTLEKWRVRIKKKRCEDELMDLYLVDVAVDGAKSRLGDKNCKNAKVEPEATSSGINENVHEDDSVAADEPTRIEEHITYDVALIPSDSIEATDMAVQPAAEQSQPAFTNLPKALPAKHDQAPPASHPPPPSVTPECTFHKAVPVNKVPAQPASQPPLPSVTPEYTKRSIFSHREKLNSNMIQEADAAPSHQAATSGSKRSIFTTQEKTQGQGG